MKFWLQNEVVILLLCSFFALGQAEYIHNDEDFGVSDIHFDQIIQYSHLAKLLGEHNQTFLGQTKAAPCSTDPKLMLGYLLFTFLNTSANILNDVSAQCKQDIVTVNHGYLLQKQWALQMLDSIDLFPGSGLLTGNIVHYPGNLEECLDVSDIPGAVKTGHWMLTLESTDIRYAYCPSGLGFARIGKCFPCSCSNQDIQKISDDYLASTLEVPHKTKVLNKNFKGEEPEGVTWGDVFMIIIASVIAVIVLGSTVIDVVENVLEIRLVRQRMLALTQGFSLYTNTSKLFATHAADTSNPNLMSCLNGIRAISISWVVIGHTLFEMCGTGLLIGNGYMIKNFGVYREDNGPLDKLFMTPFWNGMFSVDTFFLMGALLIAFHTLREMDKIKDKPVQHWIMFWFVFYLHRYIRLSAIYAIVIGFHATFLKALATGPNAHLLLNQADQCERGWWYNLLYINNFVSDIHEDARAYNCMGWTWYLANDMQFFIITPFILYMLWKSPYIGVVLCNLLLVAATAIPFALTWTDDEQFFHGKQDNFYIKPWDRFQPYLIGLLLGFVLHHMRNKKTVNFSIIFNVFMWLVSAVCASSVVYGLHEYNIIKEPEITMPPYEPPVADRAFYNGLSKLSWSFAICWVIFTCVKGRGGVVNSFLSWGFWEPLAKLSYCIYLIQYTVVYWFNSQYPTSQIYTNTLYMYTAIGNLAVCIGLAMVLYLCFEVPLAHAEKILFGLMGIGRMPSASKRNVSVKK